MFPADHSNFRGIVSVQVPLNRNRRGPRGGGVLSGALLVCAILTGCQTPVGGGREDEGRGTRDATVQSSPLGSTPLTKRSKTVRQRNGINTIPPAGDVGL